MAITGGFGTVFDLKTSRMRSWYLDRHGIKRWADNHQPVEAKDTQ